MIQLILPMAGESRRFFEAGYKEPKPFFKIGERKMIDRVLDQFPREWQRFFILNENMKAFEDEALQYLNSSNNLTYVTPNREGPLRSVEKATELTKPELPVFVSYCDYRMIWNPTDFQKFLTENNCDVAIVTYRGFHPHYCTPNMYCYVQTSEDLGGTEGLKTLNIKEKSSFTDNREREHASTGGYYFKTAALLKRGLQLQRKKDLHWQGEYFTSFAIQALMQDQPSLQVFAYEIPYFFQWGTPEDVQAYEFWENQLINKKTGEETSLPIAYRQRLDEQKNYFLKAFLL